MSTLDLSAHVVELLESIADRLEYESRQGHTEGARDVWEHCDSMPCRADRHNLAALRALLPAHDEDTCPHCGHPDRNHTGFCTALDAHPERCGCPITEEALDTVRAMVWGRPVDDWWDGAGVSG